VRKTYKPRKETNEEGKEGWTASSCTMKERLKGRIDSGERARVAEVNYLSTKRE